MNYSNKYHVARLGSNCLCITTGDLLNAVVSPISKKDRAKTKTSKTHEALLTMKKTKPVKSGQALSSVVANDALWSQKPTKLGFFESIVFLVIFYLVAVPALG